MNPYGEEFDDGDDLEFETFADNRSVIHDVELEPDYDPHEDAPLNPEYESIVDWDEEEFDVWGRY